MSYERSITATDCLAQAIKCELEECLLKYSVEMRAFP